MVMLPPKPSSKAIVKPRPDLSAWIRLFTFPPAGFGATFYHSWASLLPAGIELNNVQLPGRENRLRESAFSNMQDLVDRLEIDLQTELDRPFAFFGHSMGAWVAFELASRFEKSGRQPDYLFVSGRQSPATPDFLPAIHQLPDTAFIDELQHRYSGIPSTVLNDADLLALFLPSLRLDVTILETYTPTSISPLDLPIAVFNGENDTTLPQEALAGWKNFTRKSFSWHTFPGGHFYLQKHSDMAVAVIVDKLGAFPKGDH
jgi:medium-chain acyl-[acyl-carrier-protein] hydrolase